MDRKWESGDALTQSRAEDGKSWCPVRSTAKQGKLANSPWFSTGEDECARQDNQSPADRTRFGRISQDFADRNKR